MGVSFEIIKRQVQPILHHTIHRQLPLAGDDLWPRVLLRLIQPDHHFIALLYGSGKGDAGIKQRYRPYGGVAGDEQFLIVL